MEEDNDLVYQQFKEQRGIEKSLEKYEPNTYLKPLFRENWLVVVTTTTLNGLLTNQLEIGLHVSAVHGIVFVLTYDCCCKYFY